MANKGFKEEKPRLTMSQAVEMAGLRVDTSKTTVYTECPFCGTGSRKKKLGLTFGPDRRGHYPDGSFHCFSCEEGGGPMTFYMKVFGFSDPKEAAQDYYSKLDGKKGRKAPIPKAKAYVKKDLDLASIETRNATYKMLLSTLTLKSEHKGSLKKRGLSDADIKRFGFKSTPTFKLQEIAKTLLDKGCVLEGVPGFYKENGVWTIVKLGTGIMIPQVNGKGQIQGFQIRRDKVKEGEGRYITFSSRDRNSGSAAITPVHFVQGDSLEDIIITEGALKADVISALSGRTVISIPGVSCQTHLPRALSDLKAKGLKKVAIAFDMDILDNEKVQRAQERLKQTLAYYSIPHSELRWDKEEKGLDDWLEVKARKKREEK